MLELLNKEALTKLIDGIARKGSSLRRDIQNAAVQCIAQSIVHRNADPAIRLVNAMNKSLRKDSLVAYLETFGNLAYSKVDKTMKFYEVKVKGSPLEWTEDYANKVCELMWDEAKAAPEPVSIYDVDEAFRKFLKHATTMVSKVPDVRNKELLAILSAAEAKWHGDKAVREAKVDETVTIPEPALVW